MIDRTTLAMAGIVICAGLYMSGGIDTGLTEKWQQLSFTPEIPEAQHVYYAPCIAIDGDTLRCDSRRVRLLGIDAAELPGHCHPNRQCAPGDPHAQADALRIYANTGPLAITVLEQDRYGRDVAIVESERDGIAQCYMIRQGASYVAKWDKRGYIGRKCGVTG
ncbi:thermonuclease family protein [Alterisphingorhabdus coralli]|uniref:Thermonuclease family protein n=1 Tax=Alterisphingorhabdus coralli TaxID=3071408 RepID=A0AA97I1G5_9SPHN|nr:thermonuclease family protein [Parasphingorhabdus sp. SCSIO 66989]WOE76729.1 thermonuclease family protein [Parasphingorhabdus sp. SCSIO 66989]